MSKNDSYHYRLVDLACRHLALAAAVNVFQPKPIITTPEEPADEANGSTPATGKKRRRRGGVLGFKELAAKSKLSAWHFHRVFKSVTGLTPKTYGDKCWEYIKKVKESGEYTTFEAYSSPPPSSSSISPATSSSSPSSPELKNSQQKKTTVKMESPAQLFTTQSVADANKLSSQSISPTTNPLTPPNQYSTAFSHLNTVATEMPESFYSQSGFDDALQNLPEFSLDVAGDDAFGGLHTKAFSFPDLSKFRGDSLFGHQHQQLQQQQQQNFQPVQYSNVNAATATNENLHHHTNSLDFIPNTFLDLDFTEQLNNNNSNASSNTNNLNVNTSINNNGSFVPNVGDDNDLDFLPTTSATTFDENFFTTTTPFNHVNLNSYFGPSAGASTANPNTANNATNASNANNNTASNGNNSNTQASTTNDDIFNDTTGFFAMNPQLATSIGL